MIDKCLTVNIITRNYYSFRRLKHFKLSIKSQINKGENNIFSINKNIDFINLT